MNSMHFVFSTFIILFTLWSATVAAQAPETEPGGWQLSLGIGAGVRTNPVMNNSDMPLVVIPQINYQGDRFFIQNLDFGYELWRDQRQQVSLFLTPSYDQIFFHHWQGATFISTLQTTTGLTKDQTQPTVDPLNRFINKHQLRERRMAALGGVEYSLQGEIVDFQLQVLHELTGYYDGDEVHLALTKTIDLGRSQVKLTLGANWQSARTLDYFYGLTTTEAPGQEYSPDSGVSTLMRFDWNYQLDEHWTLNFFSSYRHLNSAIVASPLTTSDNVTTAFVGGVYHF